MDWTSQKEDPEGDRRLGGVWIGVWPLNQIPSAPLNCASETPTPPLPPHPAISLVFITVAVAFTVSYQTEVFPVDPHGSGPVRQKDFKVTPTLPSVQYRSGGWVSSNSPSPNPDPWEKHEKKEGHICVQQEVEKKERSIFSLRLDVKLLCCEQQDGTHSSTRQSKVSSWEGWKHQRDLDTFQKMTRLVWTLKNLYPPLPWLPLMHDLLHKIYLFTEPNQRKMRSTLLGLPLVRLRRLNNKDDNNDDDVFRTRSSPVVSGRKGIRGNWGAPGEPQRKQKSALDELKWTISDRPKSQALLRTVFIKDTWDNFCTNMAQITWGNVLTGGTIGALMGTGR